MERSTGTLLTGKAGITTQTQLVWGGCGAAGSWQLSWLMLGDALGPMAQACLCFLGSHTAVHLWVVTSMKTRGGLGWQR